MSGQTGDEPRNAPPEKEWEALADVLQSAVREQQRQRERDWRCKFCRLDLREVKYLRPHLVGDCLKEPMLSAATKHGVAPTLLAEAGKNPRSAKILFRQWIDTHYHELMMLAMVVELVLLALLVGLEWHR